jgi:DNA-binding NtrC family response regulator
VILSTSDELTVDTLPSELQTNQPLAVRGNKQFSAFELASAEKLHIQKVLNYTNGNKTEASRLLNIALTTLYRKIEEYGLNG